MRRLLPVLCCALGLATALPASAVEVRARKYWNDAQIEVAKGEAVRFQVSGTWRDLFYRDDAEGYAKPHMRPFESWRRIPDANWFALIGCVGRDLDHCFVVGAGDHTLSMPSDGRLYLFANDAPGFYWNNADQVSVTITKPPAP